MKINSVVSMGSWVLRAMVDVNAVGAAGQLFSSYGSWRTLYQAPVSKRLYTLDDRDWHYVQVPRSLGGIGARDTETHQGVVVASMPPQSWRTMPTT